MSVETFYIKQTQSHRHPGWSQVNLLMLSERFLLSRISLGETQNETNFDP